VQFRHLIIREIDHLITAAGELADDLAALFHAARQSYANKDAGFVRIGVAVVELGNRPSTQRLAETQETALLFRDRYGQQRFTLFAQLAET
jgi:hypothetical protein